MPGVGPICPIGGCPVRVEGCKPTGGSCPEGESCCYVGEQISGGYKNEYYTCTNLNTSPTSCGKCGNSCEFGEVCCNGVCVNTTSVGYNCNQCGCTNGMTCQNGACQCPSEKTNCSGYCTNTNSDPGNCGRCGNTCPDLGNTMCQNGACQCMTSGDIICDGACTNPYGDSRNCGSCGNVCPPGTCCSSGACVAADFQTDPNNCGSCGNTCYSFNCCSKGQCANVLNDRDNCRTCGNVCPKGYSCCNGACVDYSSDPNNCGSCGGVCGNAFGYDGFSCCNGACVDLAENADNCGSCGNVCANKCCSAGVCAGKFSSDPNNCGSCRNACISPLGNCFGSCCVNVAPTLSSVSGSPNTCNSSNNTNYWLSSAYGCDNISNLQVTLSLQQGLFSGNGFSLQLNAVPPPNQQQITWMQYIFVVTDSEVDAWVEYWNWQPSGSCVMFANNNVGSACCSNGNCCDWWDTWWDSQFGGICDNTFFLTSANYTVEPGRLSIILKSDGQGNVTEAVFQSLSNVDGSGIQLSVPIPGNLQVPVAAFQYVAVGQDNCQTANFSSGKGTITYQVPSGQELCVQGGSVPSACPLAANFPGYGFTGESSNATYGPMSACCGSSLSQSV